MLAVFSDISGPVVQVSVPRGRTVTGTFYKHRILGKLNKYFEKRRPKTGLKGIRFLHDNAPAHTSRVVTDFLKTKKSDSASPSTLLTRLGTCGLFPFSKIEKDSVWKKIWQSYCSGIRCV